MEYLERLKSRYFFTLSAFYAYEGLIELTAPNIVGKEEANKNVEEIKKYWDFFGPSKEALRVYFFLELAKLFDASDQSLHVDKIINFTQSNIRKLSASDFAEFNHDRQFVEELVKNYRGINNDDLESVKSLLTEHANTIGELKTYRDKYLAHDDLHKLEVQLTGQQIKDLFSVLEKVLNLFSSKLDHSSTMYDHIEERCKDQTKMIVDRLRRFEPYRLKEIDEQCQRELEQYRQKLS